MSYPDCNNPIIVYIDGFNLYYGLKDKGWRKFYWLNPVALSENLMKSGQFLVRVKYFTSRIDGQNAQKQKRQATYLEALGTLHGLDIHYGRFLANTTRCQHCRHESSVPKEKMTDVNVAVNLLSDAYDNRFSTALIVSGDSDLVGVVQMVTERFADKKVVMAFPPKRYSAKLEAVAHSSFVLGAKLLRDSQLPDEVPKQDGFVLQKPTLWN